MKADRIGIYAILVACALNVAVAAGFFFVGKIDPHYSPISGVIIRIFANALCLLPGLLVGRRLPKVESWSKGRELWLWGFFGLLTVVTYYDAVTALGGGCATLLNAGSGVFVVALAPALTGQKLSRLHTVGATGCLIGMLLLADFSATTAWHGYMMAVLSGLFSAIAYLMIARGGKRHSAASVVWHWSIVNCVCVAVLPLLIPLSWPHLRLAWLILILVGVAAATAQYLTAIAYQESSASLIACLSFAGPLLSMVVDFYIFRFPLSAWSVAGMGTILVCGLVIPIMQPRRSLQNR